MGVIIGSTLHQTCRCLLSISKKLTQRTLKKQRTKPTRLLLSVFTQIAYQLYPDSFQPLADHVISQAMMSGKTSNRLEQTPDGYLLFDDTVLEKRYAKEIASATSTIASGGIINDRYRHMCVCQSEVRPGVTIVTIPGGMVKPS